MKSKIKRLLALVLCLTMILNGNVSLLASDEVAAEDQVVAEAVEEMMEEVTEEATENVTEVDTVIEETENTEVTVEETEVAEEVVKEEVVNEVEDELISLQTELDGTIITMSGPKSSFPEGTKYSVSASELSDEAIADVEASLRKVELSTNEKIVSYKAYDIKLIVDGKEAQPIGDVNVTFQGKEVNEQVADAEKVEIYHVDEKKQVAVEVEGDVKNNEVIMTTDHFSTYVITTSNPEGVQVTVQHYLTSNKSQLYRDSVETLTVNEKLEDISVAANYSVDKVVKIEGSKETEVTGSDVITAATTYRVYYSPTTGEYSGSVQVFDYQVNPSNGNTFNVATNYPSGSAKNTRVSSGKVGQQKDDNTKYNTYVSVGNSTKNVNDFTGGSSVVPGIITGVDYETGSLKMGKTSSGVVMVEPGFFTTEPKTGKQVLSGFTLNFDRSGDTYTLNSIWNGSTKADDAGEDFHPLDDIANEPQDSSNQNGHNDFFGLRYDIEFKIGDYVGPLSYSFTGDDDMWVVLDAKDDANGGKVVVDLGGIHQKATGTVDIWSVLGINSSNITEAQRNQTHTLTILYMERGAGESNCNMTFTLPNSKLISSASNPTDFEFSKVNSTGAALAGATFGLYSTSGSLIDTAVSNAQGKVVFNNLYDGTYVVKETKAPSGYIKDTTEYTLTVVNRVATMTVSGNANPVISVVNYTQQEEAYKSIIKDKTATLLDANDRTFKLHLTAASQGETAGTEATSASIILVLDASSSMNTGNAFENLQNAVAGTGTEAGFIDEIASVSPNSKLGIVWYNGDERYSDSQTEIKNFVTLNSSTNINSLKSFVNNKDASSGTPMGDALEAAYNMLKSDTSNNAKYVIFFTDGMPGYANDEHGFNCMVANKAYNYAVKIKDANDGKAILYTVGYNLGSASFRWVQGHSATSTNHGTNAHTSSSSMSATTFLSSKIATSSQHAYTASSINDLHVKFETLAGTLGSLLSVQADKIVDVIDSRFVLTEASEKALKDAYGDNVKIETVNGVTTITWLNNAAKIANKKEGGWSQEIIVQAKPEFMGGNAIPTNGAESGITINGKLIPFPQPSVNVKLLDLTVEGQEITVYKGDTVDTTTFAKALADSLKAVKLYDAKDEQFEVTPKLTAEQLNQLIASGSVEVDYSYSGTADVVGKFKYELKLDVETPGTEAIEAEHIETVSGQKVEIYRLVVSYIPVSVTDRMTAPALVGINAPTVDAGTEVRTEDLGNKQVDYVVNVISGEIEITKTLKEAANEDKIFTFLVQGDNSDEAIEVSITVLAGKTSGSYKLVDLARGTYTISEKDVDGYVLDGVEIFANLTNCQNSKEDAESVTFVLGNDQSGANVIKAFTYDSKDGGTVGSVNFVNEKVFKEWAIVKRSASNDSLFLKGAEFELKSETNTYKGISGENGVIVWYHAGSDTPLQSMEYIVKGTYTLRETKAPEGYSLSNLTWTVTVAAKGYLKNIECSDKEFTDVIIDDNGGFTCFIENTALYELPQSGGLGIYTYTIGGILLMAFATLILYKNRRKEVLAR